MAHKPHKWKIRAGLLVLVASGYKVYLAAREVVKSCDVQSAQICIQSQNSLRYAIYAAVAGALVVIYGLVKRFKKRAQPSSKLYK
jgi:hypothetical protein